MRPNEVQPVAVTDADFAATVLEAQRPVLVDLVGARSGTEYRAAIDGLLH